MEQYLKLFWALNNRRRLSPALSDYLRGEARLIILPGDEILQQPGELRNDLLFIEKGILRCFLSEEESAGTCGFKFENQFIPTIREYRSHFKTSRAGISTLTEVRLWAFSAEAVRYARRQFPEFNTPYFCIYCNDMLHRQVLISARKQQSTPKEHYQLLLKLSRNQAREILHPVLAGFIGVTEAELEASLNNRQLLKIPPRAWE